MKLFIVLVLFCFTLTLSAAFGSSLPSTEAAEDPTAAVMIKLDALEIQLHEGEQRHLEELRTMRSEMISEEQRNIDNLRREYLAELERHEREANKLKRELEGLQLRFQFVSDEYSSLKAQLIEFFRKKAVSEGQPSKQEATSNITLEDQQSEPAASKSDSTENTEDSNPIRATLQISAPGGVTYTRWGRTSCDAGSTLLYDGFAAARVKDTSTSGGEFLCLHREPQWWPYGHQVRGDARIGGIEYSIFDSDPFLRSNMGNYPILDNDMPCAVCHAEMRTTQLMIPGRNTCPSGWTKEYSGYLTSTYKSIDAGSFLCLDEAPEAVPGNSAHQPYIQDIFVVETTCYGLLCPPYISGYDVTCVVCSL